jgi:hypothetical protein
MTSLSTPKNYDTIPKDGIITDINGDDQPASESSGHKNDGQSPLARWWHEKKWPDLVQACFNGCHFYIITGK